MSEMKISGPSDLIDPAVDVERAVARVSSEPTPDWQFGRVKTAKCPYCRQRPEFAIDKGQETRIASGVEGVPDLVLPRYVFSPCCSATYAKREDGSLRMNEGLSRSQERRLIAQQEKANVPTRGKIAPKAPPMEPRHAKVPAMRKTPQSGGATVTKKES